MCPSSFGYPVPAWPSLPCTLPRPGTAAPAAPLPASKAQGCCSLRPFPQGKASLFPPPPAPAWLGDTQSPGLTASTCSRNSFQETESQRQMTAAGCRTEHPFSLCRTHLDLAAASPTWAPPRLGTSRPESVLPRMPAGGGGVGVGGPRLGMEGWDVPRPECPGQV